MSNHISLVGNITRALELRYTANGTPRLVIPIATSRRFQAKGSDEPTEVTSFFTAVAWGALAEHAATSLLKGDRVSITGRVEQRTWMDAEERKHNAFEVVADDVAVSLRFRTAVIDRPERSAAQPVDSVGDFPSEPSEPSGPPEPPEVAIAVGEEVDGDELSLVDAAA
jgi:single-strand DNA-binding protein